MVLQDILHIMGIDESTKVKAVDKGFPNSILGAHHLNQLPLLGLGVILLTVNGTAQDLVHLCLRVVLIAILVITIGCLVLLDQGCQLIDDVIFLL